MPDFDDDETKIRMRTELEQQFAELRDDAQELEEITVALGAPDSIEDAIFARLAGDLYRLVVVRAGLGHVDPNEVALVATPESLLALALGQDLGADNPLAALAKTPT